MLGAILGDIAGSRFEFHNHLSKDFEFIARGCSFTDDTVMTCAVAQALMDSNRSCIPTIRRCRLKPQRTFRRPIP